MKKWSLIAACTLGLIMTAAAPANAAGNCIKIVQSNPVCKTIVCDRYHFCDITEIICSQKIDFAKWSKCTIIPQFCKPCVPETEEPETEAPETEVPETEVPETEAPETEAPETQAPETQVPETETEVPETQAPETEAPSTEEETTDNSYADQIIILVNAERTKHGLSPLILDTNLASAALQRAYEIEVSFSHTRPDGRSFSTVLAEFGVSYRGAGENIAYGQRSPEEVMQGWMNSSGHRANILNAKYTKIGVGYYQNSKGVNYWTQLFAY